MSNEIIQCRDNGTVISSEPWTAGQIVNFMWMPAGIHTICAGFRRGSIELTVQCDETTAEAVQASLDGWRAERPRQECFGCVEHAERDASFRVGASCGFKWNGDGVYLAAEPTTLGAQNVNGRVHRSWSPSFTTDADYARASEQPPKSGVLVFPEGVRGSRSNPARITGVDFCVGTLTNKPAFHSMSPVKAKEADAVTAAGTSEGVRKSWEARKQHAIGLSDKAYSATVATQGNHSYESHSAALKAHMDAGDAHSEAAGDAAKEGAMSYSSGHAKKADYHYGMADSHERHAARYVPAKATDATASAAVTAHCAAQLVQDVPDATEAETAAYEAAIDKGSGHAQAVQELRAARVAKLSASEPPTADSIAAAYEAAVAEANRIAASQGAAKLTASDVWEQCCTVTATWSEASRTAAIAAKRAKAEAMKLAGDHDGAFKEHEEANVMERAIVRPHNDKPTAKQLRNAAGGYSVRKAPRIDATDATAEEILEQIYARAGANR